jgi:hypothetical protein
MKQCFLVLGVGVFHVKHGSQRIYRFRVFPPHDKSPA